VRRAWVAAAVVAMLAAGCAKSSNAGPGNSNHNPAPSGPTTTLKPQNGGTLNIGVGAETDGWNPTSSEWALNSYYEAQTFFDPLMAWAASGQPVPYLAKAVTHSADYKTWTIDLRPGIQFSNGQPLNAAAVVLQLTKDKESLVVGQALDPMINAVATNNMTVVVHMKTPWVAFPSILASQAGYMAAPAQLDSATTSASHPIGTGPFIFKQWNQGSTLTVTRNPHYWRSNVAHVDEIVFHVYTDPTTELQALQAGQLQYMYTTEAAQIKQLEAAKQDSIYLAYPDQPAFIMLNTLAKPLNNLDLRLALEYATNQQQLLQDIDQGLGTVTTEPYKSSSKWYVPSGYPTKADLTKAKQLVADYHKQTGTSGTVKFTLGCTNSGTNPQAMQLLQSQWQQAGIDVNLSFTEQATYINNAIFGDYQANCWTQFGSPDPDIDATWWLSSNAHPIGTPALNFARLSDPTTDRELAIARSTPNQAARRAAYGQVWKQFAQQAPYIWLGRGPEALVSAPNCHGLGDMVLPDGQKQISLGADVVPWITQLWLSS
jgi:peptide/nickel transport system substrate-binding protein